MNLFSTIIINRDPYTLEFIKIVFAFIMIYIVLARKIEAKAINHQRNRPTNNFSTLCILNNETVDGKLAEFFDKLYFLKQIRIKMKLPVGT